MKKIAFKRFEREAREIDPCDFCNRNICFGCPHAEEETSEDKGGDNK